MSKAIYSALALILILPATTLAANKAGVVVQNSTGAVITRCVEFDEPEISVEELLRRTGFRLTLSQSEFGAALCYLHDDGIPNPETCFADERGFFWNFFTHDGTAWESAAAGISDTNATDGTVFGFGYGAWGEVQLPNGTFADVCEITSRAGLVIDHTDGTRRIVVVEFPGQTVTSYELLVKSGLSLVASESVWGIGICAIDGEGQPGDDCFGDPDGRFWSFSILDENDQWSSAPTGADAVLVQDGDVNGFFYTIWGVPHPAVTRQAVFEGASAVEMWAAYE